MSRPLFSKQQQKEIALRRIKQLFAEAEIQFHLHPELSHRYVQLARTIAMKVKLKMPTEFKRRYCSHCYRYLVPGVNSRVRTSAGKVVISCLECKKFMRVPLR